MAKSENCEECRHWQRARLDPKANLDAGPTRVWHCDRCGGHMERWRGQGDVDCLNCGAWYNPSGQRLRDDWAGNYSNYDDEISDLEGFETQQLRGEA